MSGKYNVVFGFFYLVTTAALGPYMVTQFFGPHMQAEHANEAAVAELTKAVELGVAGQIAQAQSDAILALNRQLTSDEPIDEIKGGPHAHGNLEALLNIAVGLVLGVLTVSQAWKAVISGLFIAGAVLHSGMLYLVTVFHLGWAGAILGTGAGPILLLAGLLLAGIASAKGFASRTSNAR